MRVDRTPEHKERLAESLEKIIDAMQDRAEWAGVLGEDDVFVILDAAAERLRELCK